MDDFLCDVTCEEYYNKEQEIMDTEKITMTYSFVDGSNTKKVEVSTGGESVSLYDLCEMFQDFVESSGFSVDAMLKYFKE